MIVNMEGCVTHQEDASALQDIQETSANTPVRTTPGELIALTPVSAKIMPGVIMVSCHEFFVKNKLFFQHFILINYY